MSKTRRRTDAQSAITRSVPPESTATDPLAGLLRILVIGLILVRWLIPTESAGAGDTLWLVQLGCAAVIVWAWSGLRSRTYTVRWSLFDWALWTLVAAHALSAAVVCVTGGDRRIAINMVWEWIGLGTTFFLLRQTIRTALDARRLATIVVALAVVLSGLGIWQHYFYYKLASREYTELINDLDAMEKDPRANPRELGKLQLKLESQGIPTDEIGRKQYVNRLQFSNEALGPFALANTFAGLLLVSLVLAGELFRTLQGPRSKAMLAAWAVALVLLLYCLILTKSRTAWTGLIVAGAVWGATLLVRNRRRITPRVWLSLGLGSVGVLLLFVIAALGKGFDAEVISQAPKSLAYRFQYWNGALQTIAASPIFGTGPGNFRHPYLRYKVAESSEEIADPHNWLLDLWTSGGILAVIAFFAFVALAVAVVRKKPTDSDPTSTLESERNASWAADLPGPVFAFLLGFIAPVASASGNFDPWQWLLLAAWLVTFALLRRGLGSARLANLALGAAAVGLMIHLSGAGGIEMPAVAQILLVLAALAFATRAQSAPVVGSPRAVIAIGGVGVVLFVALFLTSTLPVLNRRAAIASGEQALFADGQFERAEVDFANAALFDPFSPEPHDKLADALFARWQSSPPTIPIDYFAKACESLKNAMLLDPRNPSRYRRLGDFYLAQFGRSHDPTDANAAADAFQRAVEMYPTDVSSESACATAFADAGKLTEAKTYAQRALHQDEINHRWGHTDRYLPDTTLARLRKLAAGS
jgi:tetratricopeptide (TPR) repeat protein